MTYRFSVSVEFLEKLEKEEKTKNLKNDVDARLSTKTNSSAFQFRFETKHRRAELRRISFFDISLPLVSPHIPRYDPKQSKFK